MLLAERSGDQETPFASMPKRLREGEIPGEAPIHRLSLIERMRWSPSGSLTIIADGKAKNFFYLTLFERLFALAVTADTSPFC
jgi:hypothetical protein